MTIQVKKRNTGNMVCILETERKNSELKCVIVCDQGVRTAVNNSRRPIDQDAEQATKRSELKPINGTPLILPGPTSYYKHKISQRLHLKLWHETLTL